MIRKLLFLSLLLCWMIIPAARAQVPVSVLTLPGGHEEDGFLVSIHAASNGNVYFGTCSHGDSFYIQSPGEIDYISGRLFCQYLKNEES